jgi:hypothetical protein
VIRELDTIALTDDIEEYGLKGGDVGAVVHCYADGAAFEVEFVSAQGTTIGVITLDRLDMRPVGGNEILHVRELARPAA